jgi:hypothetical protein
MTDQPPIPVPAKVGVIAALIATITGTAYWLTRNPTVIWIIVGGIILVTLILLLYFYVLRRVDWKRALHLQGILDSGTPAGLSPEELARLPKDREAFVSGLSKLSQSGKSLTKMPWYLVVGESGGGKTEAIRRSDIRWLPGMNDKFAGIGGTVSMNWWFTADAILLDTAGRWMMEDDASWGQFLQQLKEHRPECPINGLLMMVPATSLMSDNAPGAGTGLSKGRAAGGGGGGKRFSLADKAELIATQFAKIQNTLGVRFPVYVIITKCDLIEGFNEFFGDLKDGHEINQVLGWSNPASLDDPFRPELVDEHLTVVRERLMRRRMRLLADPVNTDDPSHLRLEQVDALYTLPDSLLKIGPRLKQFLDTIFVAGLATDRPLFLRGIYFTSSMQEGQPWDLDLAAAMGVSPDTLPKGREHEGERQRAYFLRDLFLEKVFQEKGLVTRAQGDEVNQSHRRRKIALLGTGIAASLLLILVTVLSFFSLNQNMGQPTAFWTAVAGKLKPDEWAIVLPGKYQGQSIPSGLGDFTQDRGFRLVDALELSESHYSDRVQVPLIFGRGSIPLIPAHNALLQLSLSRPITAAAREKLQAEQEWTGSAPDVLATLLKLEVAATQPAPSGDDLANAPDQMIQYALSSDDKAKDQYKEQQPRVLKLLRGKTSAEPTNATPWTGARTPRARAQLETAIDNYVKYSSSAAAAKDATRQFETLRDKLLAFENAQRELQRTTDAPQTRAQWDPKLAGWKEAFPKLSAAHEDIAKALDPIKDESGDVVQAFNRKVLAESGKQEQGLTRLRDILVRGSDSFFKDQQVKVDAALKTVRDRNAAEAKALADELSRLKPLYLDPSPDVQQRKPRYAWQFQLCTQVNDLLQPAAEVKPTDDPDERWKQAQQRRATHEQLINTLKTFGPDDAKPIVTPTVWDNLATALRSIYLSRDAAELLRFEEASVINAWPTQAQDWGKRVADFAKLQPPGIRGRWKTPSLAMTKMPDAYQDEYFPPALNDAFAQYAAVKAMLADEKTIILDKPQLQDLFKQRTLEFDQYLDNYRRYWGQTVPGYLQFKAENWSDFKEQVRSARSEDVGIALKTLSRQMIDAATAIKDDALLAKLDAAKQKFDDDKFNGSCERALRKWQTIAGSKEPRTTILALAPTTFNQDYHTSARASDTFLALWADLPHAGLRCLAGDAKSDILASARELDNLAARFPLACPPNLIDQINGANDLSPKEVDEARQLVLKLLGNETFAEDTLARSEAIDLDCEEIMKDLRPSGLLPQAQLARYQAMRAVLLALPTADRPMRVTVRATKRNKDAESHWQHAGLRQGEAQLKDVTLRNDPREEYMGEISLPGGPLTSSSVRSTRIGSSMRAWPRRGPSGTLISRNSGRCCGYCLTLVWEYSRQTPRIPSSSSACSRCPTATGPDG